MLGFHLKLLLSVPKALWEASDRWWRVVEFGILFGIVVPPIAVILGVVENNAGWLSPLFLVLLAIIGFLLANYKRFAAVAHRADEAEQELARLQDLPVPNVVLEGFVTVPEQWVGPVRVNEDPRAGFVLARFVNEPTKSGPNVSVPDLHARIEITDQNGKTILVTPDGRWAENEDRGEAPGRITKSVPIAGNGETRTLNVVMQQRGEDDCYGWDHSGHKIAHTPIPKGRYDVEVELNGTGVSARRFYFELVNNGSADFLELRERDGFSNKSSTRRANERRNEIISLLNPFVIESNQLMDKWGRDQRPPDFHTRGLSEMLDWTDRLTKTVQRWCPEFLAEVIEDPSLRRDGKDVSLMVLQVEHRRRALTKTIAEMRQAMNPSGPVVLRHAS